MNDIEKAREEFRQAVLIALDNGYSDGMTANEVILEVDTYVKGLPFYADNAETTEKELVSIYNEWRCDHDL